MALRTLTIELVPKTAWFSNLRSELNKEWWDKIRKETYQLAGYKCEICGGKGRKWPVECHEKWEYDDENKVQRLTGLIALCPTCHQVKHFGLSSMRGKENECIRQLMDVNQWRVNEAKDYVVECFAIWKERSLHQWTMDTTWLEDTYGLQLHPK